VPLDPVFWSNPLPRGVDRNAPVDADQVSSRRGEGFQEIGRAGPKVNERDAGLSDLIEKLPAVREYVRLVAFPPNGPRPAVEDLNRLNACLDLLPQKRADPIDESTHQLMPRVRVRRHERLRRGEVLRGPPFDEVARHREGRPRESNERDPGLGPQTANRLEDEGQ